MKQPPIQLLLLLLILLIHALSVQADNPDKEKKFTISGKTQDQSNGEELIGTTIFVKELKTGTTSNEYGFYSLSLPAGSYILVFSYVGYESVTRPILLTKNERLDVRLEPADKVLQEVVISSERPDQNVKSNEMSTVKMDIRTIRKIPVLMGEVDILKAVQLLPGVQSVSEGSSGFSVRGGSADQNLILLDEATVYNASHLMGFFSVFNNDAIKDVKLYKGDIPASYGGRLASVLDVRMKEGNNQRWNVTGGIGLIASRLTVEAPILKDRSSFILSGRRTYMDLFAPLSKEEGLQDNKLYFYDLNAKINYRLDDANHFFLSGYFGRDVFKNDFAYMRLGNQTATLRWNRIITQKLFSNVTAIYSRYNYNLGSPEGTSSSFEWLSHLEDIGAKADFSYFLNTENTLRAGLSAIYHTFDPGMARGLGDASFFTEYRVPKSHALESAIYLSNDHVLGPRITAKYGLRLSMFNSIGGTTLYNYDEDYKPVDSTIYRSFEFYNTYLGLEPRLGLNYTLNEVSSLKASYSRTLQYLQLAQNSTAGTPLDIWFPASPNVKPQVSNQVAVGYFRNFYKNTFETSAEVYYKHMNHVIDFRDFAELLLNKYLEGELRIGKAWSYGIELMVRKPAGRFNGWISYTLSKTERKIPEINDGKPYPAPYDRPHNLAVVANFDILPRLSVSANWVYARGAAVTFPTGRALIGGKYIPIYSSRNAYRLPDYHRLDLSVTWKGKENPAKRFRWDVNLSVYNVYNRHNAWSINFLQDKDFPDITYAEKVYLFGIVPSITFNFHF